MTVHKSQLVRRAASGITGLGLAAALAACGADAGPPGVSAVSAPAVLVDLGSGGSDPSVLADAEQLRAMTATWLRGLGRDGAVPGDPVSIRFVTRGRLATSEHEAPTPGRDAPEGDDAPAPLTDFRAFNPATRNEFVLHLPGALLRRAGERAERSGANHGAPGEDAAPGAMPAQDRVEAVGSTEPPLTGEQGWSHNIDSRSRISSLTAATTDATYRKIVHFDNNCSGTLVGPRHIVTAAHCINEAGTNNWYSFTVTPGRAGARWAYGQSAMPHASAFSWYFTPDAWRSGGGRESDFGVLVIGDRLGDQTGWMGWWHAPADYLRSRYVYNRGYPICGSARIDDPGDPGSC